MLHKLTKFLFREFGQCKERYWLRMNETIEEADSIDSMQQYFIEQKSAIELQAQKLLQKKVGRKFEVQKEIETETLKVKIDFYEHYESEGKTAIYEVFNSRAFKSHKLWDLAFMYHVLKQAGEPITKVFAIFINPDYIYTGGEIECEQFLCVSDVTSKVKKILFKVGKKVAEAIEYAKKPLFMLYPEGHQCNNRDCLALKRFHPNPIGSVSEFKGIDKEGYKKLLGENIRELEDIPESYIITEQQKLQILLSKSNEPIINKEALKIWLEKLRYPLYFIDYEAITSSIPVYPNSKPFQHVVFQYSLDIIKEAGDKAQHFEFLPKGKEYPTPALLAALSSQVPLEGGTFLVWHDSFEKARNREMAELYPEYGPLLESINERTVDMEKVFNQDAGIYLHPGFKGRSSIKTVLPVLLPDEGSYADLDIADGMLAAILWYRYLNDSLGDLSPELLRRQLLEYCGLDTLAMVKILAFLKS
jgi:hypothetical protein